MILAIIAVLIVFAVARTVILRFSGSAVLATAAACAIVVAFVVGSFTRPFGVPQVASTEAAPDVSAAAAVAGTPDVANAHDVSAKCRAKIVPGRDGVGYFDSFSPEQAGNVGAAIKADGAVAADASYAALGWGADRDRKDVAAGVCLLADGKPVAHEIVSYGLARPDVAVAYSAPALAGSGFKIVVPPGTFAKGRHHLAVAILSQNNSFALAQNTWDIDVR